MMLLTINPGSSSLRLAAFAAGDGGLRQFAAQRFDSRENGTLGLLRDFIDSNRLHGLSAVAHRIVHGGGKLVGPCVINDAAKATIEQLIPLAPLHHPASLELIRNVSEIISSTTPQIAVFDTDFFQNLPETAAAYALPAELARQYRIRRYGFHGLAHASLYQAWVTLSGGSAGRRRVISLQLGSGCSAAAIKDGRAMDTSMGFSPMEGLMMATRCGDIDPGLLLYLQRNAGLDTEALDNMLNHKSGLLGVSGLSADMRQLLAADTPSARLAVAIYCYRLRKYIGAYLMTLGGADAIVFGGGVGENAAMVRARVLEDMQWCGIELDTRRNEQMICQAGCISAPASKVSVWVIPADEEKCLAEQAATLLGPGSAKTGGDRL